MEFKSVALLTENEYKQFKSLISATSAWWLRTPYEPTMFGVCFVNDKGDLDSMSCYRTQLGVRPACTFVINSSDSLFWCKSEKLVGEKMKYGKYSWTILAAKDNEVYALCDQILTNRIFNDGPNEWESSDLKKWLTGWSIRLRTPQGG